MSVYQRILNRIDSYKGQMVEMQRELSAIPAISPKNSGKGEYRKMLYIKKFLKDLGLKIDEYNSPDEDAENGIRPNITSIMPGSNGKITFWIMTHLDIVPPGELRFWNTNPYELKVEGDRLYARGTEDNQQDLVASIFCVKAFIEESIMPSVNIGLVIVSDEETGSEFGIQYMLKNFSVFGKDDLILVPDSGNNNGDLIEIAEKTMVWFKFTTTGRQGHASTPGEAVNSFRAASYLITRLQSLYKTFSLENSLFKPPISTFEPTKKELNVSNINTIPGEDIFYMDCRILPDYSFDDVRREIKRLIQPVEQDYNVSITCETVIIDKAAPVTPTSSPVVIAIKKAVKDVLGADAETCGIGGGTVASHFRRAGYNAAVWSKITHTAHGPNEYCLLSNMIYDAKVMAHICLNPDIS